MSPIQGSFIRAPVKSNPPHRPPWQDYHSHRQQRRPGFDCARQFLISNASKVILVCRTPSKGEAAGQKLFLDPAVKQPSPDAYVMKLDMESYTSVIEFADQVKQEVSALHILLLNAGIALTSYETSAATGHEKVAQVNYLSKALLNLELLPLLESTAAREGMPTRLTWVDSRSHEIDRDLPQTLDSTESILRRMDNQSLLSARAQYANSKLLFVMFFSELAQRTADDKVIINSVCPGTVKTAIADSAQST